MARQRSLKKKKRLPGVTYVLDASAVVDDDDIERGVLAAVPAPEEVPAEPVDRLLELSLASAGAFSPVACHSQVSQQSRMNSLQPHTWQPKFWANQNWEEYSDCTMLY